MNTYRVKIKKGTTTHSIIVSARSSEEALQEASRIIGVSNPEGTVTPMPEKP